MPNRTILTNNELPPELKKGRGKPITGVTPTFMPIFIAKCENNKLRTPIITKILKLSLAIDERFNNLIKIIKNNIKTSILPKNPKKIIEEKEAILIPSFTEIIQMKKPASKQPGRIIGSDSSAVPELVRLLREEAKVI